MKNLRSEPTPQFIQPCLDVLKLSNWDYGDMVIKQYTQKHQNNLNTSREILEEKITPFIFDKAQQGDDQHNVALWYKKI